MIKRIITRTNLLAGGLVMLCSLSVSGGAGALAKPITADASANNGQAVQAIISKGDQEISRRLTTLGTLATKISGATKLSASDKSALQTEVSNETSGLTSLKAKLDAETTLSGARADAQSIYTDYRVYALIVPKVELIKTADDQQVVETKLTALATKLQARLTTAKSNGKDVKALQAKLSDLNQQVNGAQAISGSIETKVIGLQPSDYDSDHAVLSGDAVQLKNAHNDNQAAIADAKAIISGLQNL